MDAQLADIKASTGGAVQNPTAGVGGDAASEAVYR